LRVLLSCREEYRGEIDRLAAELLPRSLSFSLPLLSQDAARGAIILPAHNRGFAIEPLLVNALVETLATNRYIDDRGNLRVEPGQYIDPLHLQVVCEALWSALTQTLPEGTKNIRWSHVNSILPDQRNRGATPYIENPIAFFVSSALDQFCENVIESVAARTGTSVDVIDIGCKQFISSRGTRSIVHEAPERTGEIPTHVAKGLAEGHLLSVTDQHGERLYELAHDRLIEPISARVAKARERRRLSTFPKVIFIVFACVTAVMLTVLVTMSVRAGLAYFRWTLTQAPDVGFVAGWFQGVIGALVWCIFITGGLCWRWYFVKRSRDIRHPLLHAAGVGLIFGVIGAAAITVALLWAQREDSLYGALWTAASKGARGTAFTVSGFGYSMFFFGAAIGLGCGTAAKRALLRPEWDSKIKNYARPKTWVAAGRVLLAISRLVFQESWSLAIPMLVAALLFGLVVHQFQLHVVQPQLDPSVNALARLSAPLPIRIAGECISITGGGFGLVTGLLYGLYFFDKVIETSED
jgi:hypothetical protein